MKVIVALLWCKITKFYLRSLFNDTQVSVKQDDGSVLKALTPFVFLLFKAQP